MVWFKAEKFSLARLSSKKSKIPEGLWAKCLACKEIIYKKEIERNNNVCPKCNYHFRISAQERLQLVVDEGSFAQEDSLLMSADPLKFKDTKRYSSRLKQSRNSTGLREAIICGSASINGLRTEICIFEFGFMGGSMGSVVGEKVTRAVERAMSLSSPLIIICASGGARMQEGILSLMQMAKTSAALAKLSQAKLPYISVLTDPTTGGVSASLAMLGDIIIAEPGALVGFTGPRVIQQTIKQELPLGFQRSEFLFEHGQIDLVVSRSRLKSTLFSLLSMLL